MMCNNPLDDIEDVDEDADEVDDPNVPEIPADLPDPVSVLQPYREPAPRWLGPVTRFTRATFKQFLRGRVAFYPNAGGEDGQLFSLFAKSHSVHCFIHADLDNPARKILSTLQEDGQHRLYGYDPVFDKIIPSNWWQLSEQPPHHGEWLFEFSEEDRERLRFAAADTSLFVVLRRRDEFSDDHGPEYLCFLHVLADACLLYWNLWGRHDQAPFAMLLESDMTWRDSDIEALLNVAKEAEFPEFLLVAEGEQCWPGYEAVSGLSEPSGMSQRERRLYRRMEIH
jgi:hypothetical protein